MQGGRLQRLTKVIAYKPLGALKPSKPCIFSSIAHLIKKINGKLGE